MCLLLLHPTAKTLLHRGFKRKREGEREKTGHVGAHGKGEESEEIPVRLPLSSPVLQLFSAPICSPSPLEKPQGNSVEEGDPAVGNKILKYYTCMQCIRAFKFLLPFSAVVKNEKSSEKCLIL